MPKKISPKVFEIYREEVRGYLPAVRTALGAFRDDDSCREELEEARRQIHIIKGSSARVGMKPLSHVASEMEQILEALLGRTLNPSNELAGLLTTALDVISNCIESSESPENKSFAGCDELLAALKKLTSSLQPRTTGNAPPTPENETPVAQAETADPAQASVPNTPKKIPQELLDVFLLEAEDHFKILPAGQI